MLKRSTLLTTLPTLAKEWRVSFEINPKSYTYRSYAQVLQMTIGGKSGNIGDRTPSLWFHKTRGVYIVTTLNGRANVGKFLKPLPPAGEWTTIEIMQAKENSNYMFSLTIGGDRVWSVANSKPEEFSDVEVYASTPWYVAQAGYIRGLLIENKIRGRNQINLKFFQSSFFPVEGTEVEWSEWSACTKNRTRPQICPAADSCPLEVETEECEAGSPGIFIFIKVPQKL